MAAGILCSAVVRFMEIVLVVKHLLTCALNSITRLKPALVGTDVARRCTYMAFRN